MLRRLFVIVSIISLALCVSTAAFWGVSYAMRWEVAGESIDADRLGRTEYSLEFERGGIALHCMRFKVAANVPAGFKRYFQSGQQSGLSFRYGYYSSGYVHQKRWHFAWISPRGRVYVGGELRADAPCWILFLLTAIAPGLWLRQRVRERKTLDPGFCSACGYDLRASPHRCPECGKLVAGTSGTSLPTT